MLPCTIKGVAQDMDFESGLTLTYLLLLLPDGTRLRAAVDQGAAEKVIGLQVKSGGTIPKPAVRAGAVDQGTQDESSLEPPVGDEYDETEPVPAEPDETGLSEGANVFGGDLPDAPAPPRQPAPAAPAPPPPAPEQPADRRRRGRTPKPQRQVPEARTVPKDDRGYPVVPGAGVDTAEITGGRDVDEDGVGQV